MDSIESLKKQLFNSPNKELERIKQEIDKIIEFRKQSPDVPIIPIEFEIKIGDVRQGTLVWIRRVEQLILENGTMYDVRGEFVKFNQRLNKGKFPAAEGSFVIIGGRGSTWKVRIKTAILCKAVRGAVLDYKYENQRFLASNLEFVETSHRQLTVAEIEKAVSAYPKIGYALRRGNIALFKALKENGF